MRRAVIDRRTTETQIALTLALDGKGRYRRAHRHPLPRSHAGAVRAARRVRSDGRRATAISTSISTTPSRISASRSARRSRRRSATAAASTAPATSSCRWTRRWPSPPSISAAGRTRSSTCRSTVARVGDLQTELVHDFFEGLRDRRAGERARQGAVRPLEPSQDRSGVQGVRARAAGRVRERQAARADAAEHQRACCDRADRLQGRQPDVGARRRWPRSAPTCSCRRRPDELAERSRRSSCPASAISARRARSTALDRGDPRARRRRPAAARHLPRHAVAVRRQRRSAGLPGPRPASGRCYRLPQRRPPSATPVKVPHVGWNSLTIQRDGVDPRRRARPARRSTSRTAMPRR